MGESGTARGDASPGLLDGWLPAAPRPGCASTGVGFAVLAGWSEGRGGTWVVSTPNLPWKPSSSPGVGAALFHHGQFCPIPRLLLKGVSFFHTCYYFGSAGVK